ncbi:unnamed protein product, partial [Brachionus calyciflorus]
QQHYLQQLLQQSTVGQSNSNIYQQYLSFLPVLYNFYSSTSSSFSSTTASVQTSPISFNNLKRSNNEEFTYNIINQNEPLDLSFKKAKI